MGLKKRVKKLEGDLGKAIQRIKEQDEIIEALRKELYLYKNSNTPSSSNKHMKPDTSGKQNKKNSKRGAPFGHVGKTRQQIPTRKEIVDDNECPNCHGHNIVDDKIINQIIEEIQEPIAPEIIEAEIHQKECLDCGIKFIPP